MKRSLIAAALLVACAMASAQTYNPKIAYTRYEGKSDNLYLANADGSSPVIVYRSGKVGLGGIDIAPTNAATPAVGRIAFVQSGVLKILSYTVAARGISATVPTTLDSTGAPYLGARNPDFSPDGSRIIYTRDTLPGPPSATEIRVIASAGSTPPKVLYASSGFIGLARWLTASDFVFDDHAGSPAPSEIRLASLDASDNLVSPPLTMFTTGDPELLQAVGGGTNTGIEDFDVARTRPSLVFTTGNSLGGTGNFRDFVEYDMSTGAFTKRFSNNGWRVHFSSDDAYLFYLHGNSRTSSLYDYVYRFDIASGNTTQLASKAQYGYDDAKP